MIIWATTYLLELGFLLGEPIFQCKVLACHYLKSFLVAILNGLHLYAQILDSFMKVFDNVGEFAILLEQLFDLVRTQALRRSLRLPKSQRILLVQLLTRLLLP